MQDDCGLWYPHSLIGVAPDVAALVKEALALIGVAPLVKGVGEEVGAGRATSLRRHASRRNRTAAAEDLSEKWRHGAYDGRLTDGGESSMVSHGDNGSDCNCDCDWLNNNGEAALVRQ